MQTLNAESNRAVAMPDVRQKLAGLGGGTSGGLSLAAFGFFLAEEIARYRKVIIDAGVSQDAATQ